MEDAGELVSLLRLTAIAYEPEAGDAVLEEEIHSFDWHGDLHLKIRLGRRAYSARFIGADRYRQPGNEEFVPLTNRVLADQMVYGEFLAAQGIPFMRLKRTADGAPFAEMAWKGRPYRAVLFHWMDGQPITHTTPTAAFRMGQMARRIHDAAADFPRPLSFPATSHVEGYRKRMEAVRDFLRMQGTAAPALGGIEAYLAAAERHVANADRPFRSGMIAVTSDFNSLNVLWNEAEEICGIVDFEHMSYGERVETLAWLVKWYSRTEGIESHAVSPLLAREMLRGYGADALLTEGDYERLRSLLWLAGCMNWHFVDKTLKVLQSADGERLAAHLARYQSRGQALLSLVEGL